MSTKADKNRPIAGGRPMQLALQRLKERNIAVGVFFKSVYMFSSNCALLFSTFVVAMHAPLARADAAVAYIANPGDCLSGIVKAHYPDTTGYSFVLHQNPDIQDDDHIEVGQKIVLPGLDPSLLRTEIDQTGCNAAANARRSLASKRFSNQAVVVAKSRPEHTEQRAMVATTTTTTSILTDQTEAAKRESSTAMLPTPAAASTPTTEPKPTVVAKRSPQPQRSAPREIATGTIPVSIDASQRTVAVKPRGQATRVVTPMPAEPRFAIDERSHDQASTNRQSTPNRYVVNAIGAKTNSAATALVQHPDQHFYVEARAEWQDAANAHALQGSREPPVPIVEPIANTTTPLQDALAQGGERKTERAGNILIDQSLLLKTAAQSGGHP